VLRAVRREAAEEKTQLEERLADLKADLAGTKAALDSLRRKAEATGPESGDPAVLRAEAEKARAEAEVRRDENAALKKQLVEQKEESDARQVESLERYHLQKMGYEKLLRERGKEAGSPAPAPLVQPAPEADWWQRLSRWWSST
jgi:hypothetical protein